MKPKANGHNCAKSLLKESRATTVLNRYWREQSQNFPSHLILIIQNLNSGRNSPMNESSLKRSQSWREPILDLNLRFLLCTCLAINILLLWLLFQVQQIKNAVKDLFEMRTEKKVWKGQWHSIFVLSICDCFKTNCDMQSFFMTIQKRTTYYNK